MSLLQAIHEYLVQRGRLWLIPIAILILIFSCVLFMLIKNFNRSPLLNYGRWRLLCVLC
ncbi:DUF5989 family protein [Marinomonas primoryensis]|uniref:DUF5989 family protein n=1 Tax=Marinomonas primoryensis TaxID=178399 RepID=UPI0037038F05